jgi:hypothetical protein
MPMLIGRSIKAALAIVPVTALLLGSVALGSQGSRMVVLEPLPPLPDVQGKGVQASIRPLSREFLQSFLGLPGAPSNRPARSKVDAVRTVSEGSPTPPGANDDFRSPTAIDRVPYTDSTQTEMATRESGEPVGCTSLGEVPLQKTVWYRFTPSRSAGVSVDTLGSDYDTTLTVYSGSSFADLSEITCNNDTGPKLQSVVVFSATRATTYLIQVAGKSGGHLVLHLDEIAEAAPNDDFGKAQRVVLREGRFEHHVNTSGATTEIGEPSQCSRRGTVWYRFTPSAPVEIVADTLGSNFDTTLAVYTGSGLRSLRFIACSDDSGGTYQSLVSLPVAGGTTYFFQAGGTIAENRGDLVFHLRLGSKPANDTFASAAPIGALPFTRHVDTTSATLDLDEPRNYPPCSEEKSATVWYKLTPATTMAVTAETFGSDYDTVIAVYSGSDEANLLQEACNNNAFGVTGEESMNASVQFLALAARTYFIQVGGVGTSNNRGHLVFTLCEATC